MDKATPVSTALARGVVLVLFSLVCYQTGFNAGYADGEFHSVPRPSDRRRANTQVFPPFQWSPARPPPAAASVGPRDGQQPLALDNADDTDRHPWPAD